MKYPNAPIREAVFDIQVSNTERMSQVEIENLHTLFSSKYPKKRVLNRFFGKLEMKDGNGISNNTNSEFRGLIFSNNSNNRQVQFRIDGFTLNFLSPYNNWEELFSEAKKLWEIYNSGLNPIKINRIALRFINKIDIPLPFISFQEYITNMPPIPKSLPQFYKNFFMQIEVPCEYEKYTAIITETIETPTKEIIPFILDIDVFKEIHNDFNIDDFKYLRLIKNSIFEDFITDKTRNLFKND